MGFLSRGFDSVTMHNIFFVVVFLPLSKTALVLAKKKYFHW